MNIEALLFGATQKTITYKSRKTGEQEGFEKYSLSIMIDWVLYNAATTEECLEKANGLLNDKPQNDHFVDAILTVKFEKWKFDALEIVIVNIV